MKQIKKGVFFILATLVFMNNVNAITSNDVTYDNDGTTENLTTTLDNLYSELKKYKTGGSVQSNQMLEGATGYSKGVLVTGTIKSKAATTYTPGTSNQTIAAGQYLSGAQTIKGDANLTAGNIAKGKSIFGISGTYTSDANATAGNILSGKTAYVNGSKVTGTIASKGTTTYTPGTSNQTIAAGQYLSGAQTIKGDANLVAANIAKGKSIFGVSGTYVSSVNMFDTKGMNYGTESQCSVDVVVANDLTPGKYMFFGVIEKDGIGNSGVVVDLAPTSCGNKLCSGVNSVKTLGSGVAWDMYSVVYSLQITETRKANNAMMRIFSPDCSVKAPYIFVYYWLKIDN